MSWVAGDIAFASGQLWVWKGILFHQNIDCFYGSIKAVLNWLCWNLCKIEKKKLVKNRCWCAKNTSDPAATHYSVPSQIYQECSALLWCFQCIGRQWDEYRRTRSGAPVCVVQSLPSHHWYTCGSRRSQESGDYCITRSNMSGKSVRPVLKIPSIGDNYKRKTPVMHDSNPGIGIDSGMIPFFVGIGIEIGIKNIKIEWNRNWNRNQWFQPWNHNRNQGFTISHHLQVEMIS